MRKQAGPGRPSVTLFGSPKCIRFHDRDIEDAEALAQYWRCTMAEAIRRSVREMAERAREAGRAA